MFGLIFKLECTWRKYYFFKINIFDIFKILIFLGISTEYYENKINKQLIILKTEKVAFANSKIFTIVSKGKIKSFITF